MKKFLALLFISILAVTAFAGGNRTRTTAAVESGAYLTFGGSATLDTIVVSDTLNYVTVINTTKRLNPFLQLANTKVGAGTATVVVTFWESLDGVNFAQVVKGKLQAAYTKTLTLSATGNSFISFEKDSIIYNGRYLKTRLVTSSTASVKQVITYKLKALER